MRENSRRGRRGAGRLGLRKGPLTRRSDRLQALARLLLLVAVLATIPIAVTWSVASYAGFHRQAIAVAHSGQEVTATLLADATPPQQNPDGTGPGTPQSLVIWATAAGGHRQEVVPVPDGATAGSSVHLWIDPRGAVSTTPPGGGDPVAQALGVGVLIIIVGPSLAAGAYLLVRGLLNRRRLREWASGWEAVEPVWSRKVR